MVRRRRCGREGTPRCARRGRRRAAEDCQSSVSSGGYRARRVARGGRCLARSGSVSAGDGRCPSLLGGGRCGISGLGTERPRNRSFAVRRAHRVRHEEQALVASVPFAISRATSIRAPSRAQRVAEDRRAWWCPRRRAARQPDAGGGAGARSRLRSRFANARSHRGVTSWAASRGRPVTPRPEPRP